MTVRAALSQSTNSFQVGATPPPWAALGVSNDGASAVVVTGVELYVTDIANNPLRGWAGNMPLVPIGVGQNTTVPAAGSITIGPFAVTAPNAASANQFQAVPPSALPSNSQGALPAQQQIYLRARVYASDGSVTEASPAQFFVSYATPPPKAFQGGAVQFNDINDAALLSAVL